MFHYHVNKLLLLHHSTNADSTKSEDIKYNKTKLCYERIEVEESNDPFLLNVK